MTDLGDGQVSHFYTSSHIGKFGCFFLVQGEEPSHLGLGCCLYPKLNLLDFVALNLLFNLVSSVASSFLFSNFFEFTSLACVANLTLEMREGS